MDESHVFAFARLLASSVARSTKKPCSIVTQRTYLNVVQRLFRFLLKQGLILSDPSLDLVLPSWKKLPRATINQAQSQRLIANPDPNTARAKRDRAFLELLYGTGLRVRECAKLELRDLDLMKGSLFVHQGTGKKDRVVPISGRASAAVDLYLREGRPGLVRSPRQQALFLKASGAPVESSTIQAVVRGAAKAARTPLGVTSHTLRHTCATHLLRNGADIAQVQKLLGHAHISTTAIYTRVFPKDLAAVLQRAHPRERKYNRPRKRTL